MLLPMYFCVIYFHVRPYGHVSHVFLAAQVLVQPYFACQELFALEVRSRVYYTRKSNFSTVCIVITSKPLTTQKYVVALYLLVFGDGT